MLAVEPGVFVCRVKCGACDRETEHQELVPARLKMLGVLASGAPFVVHIAGSFICERCCDELKTLGGR